ncbi:MAG: neutral zinc metallopeptidase, partial [Candidatus Acidiferrum sp.]
HVQKLLGTSDKMAAFRERASKKEYNRASVRLELQADFLAGVWAYHGNMKQHFLEAGDIESALRAANAIGDDRLQKQAQGYVVPDSFTHGTSAQRIKWFRRGFETGDIRQGDTFKVPDNEL